MVLVIIAGHIDLSVGSVAAFVGIVVAIADARLDEADDLGIVRQLLRAHEYWRLKLIDVDLVILNEQGTTYAQDLSDALETLVRTSQSILVPEGHRGRGGVSIVRGDRLTSQDRTLFLSVARAVLLSRRGSLADQVIRLERPEPAARTSVGSVASVASSVASSIAASVPTRLSRRPRSESNGMGSDVAVPSRDLEFFNGLGGFADDGTEYVTILGPGQVTPAPWLNVIANPEFGFQVSESGAGYTWSQNSRENQLTPWSNDPVSDPVGEAIYVRDEESGEFWSPTALPIRLEGSTYVARHGAGYSRFEHVHDGISLDLVQFVPARRSAQGLRAHRAEPVRPVAAPLGHGVRGMGPRHVARRQRAAHRHRARSRHGCDPRTRLVEHGVSRSRRVPRPRRPADGMDRGPDGVPRPQRRIGSTGRPGARPPPAAGRRRRHGSLRRPSDELRPGRRSGDADRRAAGSGPRSGRAGPHRTRSGGRSRSARWPRSGASGTRSSARSRCGRPIDRWTSS